MSRDAGSDGILILARAARNPDIPHRIAESLSTTCN
jgi:hypothetical protein